MICTKEFTISILGACLNVACDAAWTYNPNSNPGQPLAGFDYDVEGYEGEWSFAATGITSQPTAHWRLQWVGSSPKIARVTATMVGSVTRDAVGVGATYNCHTDVNTITDTDSILCPVNSSIGVNLTATSQRACNLVNPNFVEVSFQIPSNDSAGDSYSLSGTITLECIDP